MQRPGPIVPPGVDPARGKRREPLVVESGDRTEARVLLGELSPAGAGLVELEQGRDV